MTNRKSTPPGSVDPCVSKFSNFWASAKRSRSLTSRNDSTITNLRDGLVRGLGLFELILIGIGASIGAGIFVITGTVARVAGPGVTISFLIAGISCMLNALCYAELASQFPAIVGGAYLYTYTAFNEITAFLIFGQLMLDYHIGAASIARSLSSYIFTFLKIFPFFNGNLPNWIGYGSDNLFGLISINILAPIILAILTLILCWGIGEYSFLNTFMTSIKVVIVLIVILVGSFEVDISNWSPFAPGGSKAILTGATVVFFAYIGFDAVANSAEESKRPQRDLPLAIIGSLSTCIALYIGVSLVLSGMIPYNLLGEEAPLAEAFESKGLKYISVLISVAAIAGLTTTLLVGLYVQSRLYMGLGRDCLLPSFFAKVHPIHRTPINSQIWVGIVSGVLAGALNVHSLSHILSVGSLVGYSVVSACVVTLRWKETTESKESLRWVSSHRGGITCLVIVGCCGFSAGLVYRSGISSIILIVAVATAIVAIVILSSSLSYAYPPGFSCPGVPVLPAVGIFINMFLFAQLHYEAWLRFIVLNVIMTTIYAFYGQHHAKPSPSETLVYIQAPNEDML